MRSGRSTRIRVSFENVVPKKTCQKTDFFLVKQMLLFNDTDGIKNRRIISKLSLYYFYKKKLKK